MNGAAVCAGSDRVFFGQGGHHEHLDLALDLSEPLVEQVHDTHDRGGEMVELSHDVVDEPCFRVPEHPLREALRTASRPEGNLRVEVGGAVGQLQRVGEMVVVGAGRGEA